MTANRLPLIMFVAAGLVIVAVIAIVSGSWVATVIALVIHLIATAVVMKGAFQSVGDADRSDHDSQQLDERAGDAVGDDRRNVQTEIEALKQEPAAR